VQRELRRFGPNAEIGAAVEAWPAAVGEEIARNAWPARFQRDGTLIVHARDSIWAFELTQRAAQIAERLPNTPTLKFVPGPLPARGVEPPQATPQGSPPATVAQIEQAAEWTAAIEDDELRNLVAKAAELSLARSTAGHPF
jgi:Dna[CI] antecedent, DciA